MIAEVRFELAIRFSRHPSQGFPLAELKPLVRGGFFFNF